MAELSDFYPYVLIDVPGCPEVVVDTALRSALIEFCEKSLVVQRDLDPVTVVAGTSDYDLEPPTFQLVSKILKLWYKSTELSPMAPDNIKNAEVYNRLFTDADTGRSDPRFFLQKDTTTFSIYPVPKNTVANAITIRAALKPSRSASTVEDVLFQDYAETIAQGAKYRLLSMPGKPWMNGPASAAALSMFTAGVNVARQRASRGGTRADLRVQIRSF